MKSSAITRIIIWSVVLVILSGVLIWGLGFGGSVWHWNWNWLRHGNTGNYEYGSASFEAGKIDEVQVEWVGGFVTIEEGDHVEFEESANRELDEDEKLTYQLDGRKLTIQQTRRTFFFGNTPTKNLQLTLPKELKELKVTVVSADVTMDGQFSIEEASFEGVSGSWKIRELSSRDIDLETVSGNFDLTIGSMPKDVDFDSVSGNVVLWLPENTGFTVEHDGVSGDLDCDFPTKSQKDRQIYGDGSTQIDGDSVSGDLMIKQK